MSDLVERVRAALSEITPTGQDGRDMLALLAESADRIEALEAQLASRSVWLIWHHGNPPDGRVLWACTTEEEAKRACEAQLAWGDMADYEECRLCDETTVYEDGYPKEGA